MQQEMSRNDVQRLICSETGRQQTESTVKTDLGTTVGVGWLVGWCLMAVF